MRRLKKILIGAICILALFALAGRLSFLWLRDYSVDMDDSSGIPAVASERPPVVEDSLAWPSWKGPTDNNRAAFSDIRTDWSGGLQKLWEADYLCRGDQSIAWSSPAVSGNHLVVPGRHDSSDIIFCMHPQSGALLWYHRYHAPAENASYGEGPRGMPTIDGDRVYTVSRGGILLCLGLADGAIRWERSYLDMGGAEPKWGFAGAPVVYGDALFVQVGGTALVHALDKYTGKTIWQSDPAPASYSTPAVVGVDSAQMMLVVGGQEFFALDPLTGGTLWSTPWAVANNINICTPAFDRQRQVAVISAWYNKGTQAVRIHRERPEVLWHSKELTAHQTDPIIIDGYVYGFSGMSAHNNDDFVCLDLMTGEKQWDSKELGTGQFIQVGPWFLSVDVKGSLYLAKATPEKLEIASRVDKLIETDKARMWSKPVAAQGNVYLRYANRLWCYELVEG